MTTTVLSPTFIGFISGYASQVDTDFWGGNPFIGEGNDLVAAVRRGYVKFDFSGIPENAIVSSVVLSMTTSDDKSSNARTCRVYRLRRTLAEPCTWNKYDGTNSWTTAGGFTATDVDTTSSGSCNFSATEADGTVKTFSLTAADVMQMISGEFTNKGFMIKMDTESDDEYVFTAASVTLTVTYELPSNNIMWWY